MLAAAGSAVGLGNIWRFPIMTGQNGGAAFILVYIACVIFMGLPIMLSEFMIGRHTQANTARAYQILAPGTPWRWVGRLGVFTGFIILGYYCVVAGWTVQYAGLALFNKFEGHTATDYPQMFQDFVSNPWLTALWTVFFVLLTHVIVVRGVTKGIERWSKVLMPALFAVVIILAVCAVMLPGAGRGLDFLLRPDFSKINGTVVLNAMGQAFFSLSLGMGCLCTYASYFDRKTSLAHVAVQVVTIDTVVALLAGFIIFPAASSANYSLQPEDIGPSLIFITLPNVFQQAFGGLPIVAYIFSVLFYFLLIVASLTSTISMHEVVTSYMSEEFNMSRKKAAVFETLCSAVLGVISALSFSVLAGFKLFDKNIFDCFDYLASNICLPLGGMFIALFTGWYLDKQLFRDELTNGGERRAPYFKALIFVLRYVVPILIFFLFLNLVGLF